MKTVNKFTKFDNYRLYLRLKKAGDKGNTESAKLARKMGYKYQTKPFIQEYELFQMQEITEKALSGNIRSIVKIRKMQEAEQKEILKNQFKKLYGHGGHYKSSRNSA